MPKKINLQNLKLGYTDGTKVSDEDTKAFLLKLNEMSEKYKGTTPEDFLTLFIKENGLKDGVLLLDQKSKAKTNSNGGRARGLIQFVPSTAEGLGLDQEKTATMTPVEQLDFVDKFYNTYKDNITDYQSLYLSTFYPAALKQGDDFVIAETEETAYSANRGVDVNNDGKITVADFKSYAANTKPAQPKNLFEEVSDEDYLKSYNDLLSPPKPKYLTGEDDKGSYVDVLIDEGQPKIDFDPNVRGSSSKAGERYERQYIEGAESIGVRTIGNNEYVVKAFTDDEGVLQNEYLSFTEEGAGKNKLKKEDKETLYKREIAEIMQGGLTKENVNKAKDVYENAKEDYRQSGSDNNKVKEKQRLHLIANDYYDLAAAPYLKEELKTIKKQQQKKLLNLQNEYANAFGEEKIKIGEQIKSVETEYSNAAKREKSLTSKLTRISEGKKPIEEGSLTKSNYGTKDQNTRYKFDYYENIFSGKDEEIKEYQKSISYQDYNTDLINKEKERLRIEQENSSLNNNKSVDITTKNLIDDNDTREQPDNLENQEEDYNAEGKDYLDKDYIKEQLAEIDEQLNNAKKAKEFTPDLSALESKDKYGNLIAQAGDLGAGIIGLKGAMEEVPEYQKGEMFNAYTDEAYRQRNMGLSSEEMGLRKQLSERGFGYDVKNIRRLSGGSAGVALGNLGRASSGLQDRYSQIAAEDSATRRINQQRFDRAALTDENFNRKKFEDSFKTTMLNKEMGAQLVRDKMKNMNERAQFEKQYGKDSIYQALSKEMLIGKQYNNNALKMAEEYQKEKAKDYLTDRQARLNADLKKANNQ